MGMREGNSVRIPRNMVARVIILVEWIRDILRQRTMDAMMMLLARRDFTTDLAGLWLSNILAHYLVLPE